jgi:hypothetical protein
MDIHFLRRPKNNICFGRNHLFEFAADFCCGRYQALHEAMDDLAGQ